MIKSLLNELTANTGGALLFLFVAAVLEVLGDAWLQSGLHREVGLRRVLFSLAGGITLVLYGVTVNLPRWKFGKLLGIYVVFFFLVAQMTAWLRFGEVPTSSVIIGGTLIVVGGVIMCLGRF
jgi:hypothetical protein